MRRAVMVVLVALLLTSCAGGDERDQGSAASTAPVATGTAPPATRPVVTPRPPSTTPDLKVELVSSGFSNLPKARPTLPTRASYGAVVRNPNKGWIALGVTVQVSFFDAAAKLLKIEKPSVDVLLPEAAGAVANTLSIEGADKIEVRVTIRQWRRSTEPWPTLSVDNTSIVAGGGTGQQFIGEVSSSFASEQKNVRVVAVAVMGLAIVGGATTTVPSVAANGKVPFVIASPAKFPAEVNAVKIYATPTKLPTLP